MLESKASHDDSINVLAALWRYRWAVILPTVAGLVAGFLVFLQLPEVFRSTTRLMIETDQPAVLDAMTGDLLGGVPSLEIVRSQLYSDQVVTSAFNQPLMQPHLDSFGNNPASFVEAAQNQLILEPEVFDTHTSKSLVMLLHYECKDKSLCADAVHSFSESLQKFFSRKHQDSRSELIKLISEATENMLPKMQELEKRYGDFRRDAPLAWNEEGKAYNPHREKQLFLIGKRSELVEEYRRKSAGLAAIESIVKKSSKDPLLALNIIGQLLGQRFELPRQNDPGIDALQGDNPLAQIEVDKQLIPLMIEANKYEAEYGPNHPTVKSVKSDLAIMKNELRRLVERETSRIVELMEKQANEKRVVDPIARAREAVNAVVYASKSQVELLATEVKQLNEQIADEQREANKLAEYEQENSAQLREIERTRGLFDQLEERMARVSLVNEEPVTRVIELTAPTAAIQVGPSIIKTVGIAGFLGILLGVGLAMLLEKNANTFRDPDEIAGLLGIPVLTHVPFFRSKVGKGKKTKDSRYSKLDPYLTVLHNPASVASEAMRSCRTSIFFEMPSIDGGKIIQITSPLPGDGKSTIAGNLACSIAQSGKRVLAIDCDLRRPQLTDNFALGEKYGLTDVLNRFCEVADACHPTPLESLDVMPSGPIPSNPAEALSLPEMNDLLEMLRLQYDYIILDTPPLLVVTDPSITAGLADGVIMTMRIRRKSKPNAKESVNILRSVGAHILGLVINNSDESASSDGYRGYGYYQYGRYTTRYSRGDAAKKSSKSGQNGTEVIVSGRAKPSLVSSGFPSVSLEESGRSPTAETGRVVESNVPSQSPPQQDD